MLQEVPDDEGLLVEFEHAEAFVCLVVEEVEFLALDALGRLVVQLHDLQHDLVADFLVDERLNVLVVRVERPAGQHAREHLALADVEVAEREEFVGEDQAKAGAAVAVLAGRLEDVDLLAVAELGTEHEFVALARTDLGHAQFVAQLHTLGTLLHFAALAALDHLPLLLGRHRGDLAQLARD